MTVVEIAERISRPDGLAWAHVFEESHLVDALREAKEDFGLSAYVQIPRQYLDKVLARAARHLHRDHPVRMEEGLADYLADREDALKKAEVEKREEAPPPSILRRPG